MLAVTLLLLAAGYLVSWLQYRGLVAEFGVLKVQQANAVRRDELLQQQQMADDIAAGNARLAGELAVLQEENRELAAMIAQIEDLLQKQARQPAAAPAGPPEGDRELEVASASAADTAAGGMESQGQWFVNFGSYVHRGIAERWAARLQVAEGDIAIQEAEVSGRKLFRVRVVGLGSRATAEALAVKLQQQYRLSPLWVGRSGSD